MQVGEDFEFITVGLPELYFPSLYLIESDTLLTDMPKLKSINMPSIVIMEGAIEMNGLPMLEVFGKLYSRIFLLYLLIIDNPHVNYSNFTQTFQLRSLDPIQPKT